MNEVELAKVWKRAVESLVFSGRVDREIALVAFGWAKFLGFPRDLVIKVVFCYVLLSMEELNRLYDEAKVLVFKPNLRVERHKIVKEVLELIQIGPVKRQDLIAKFKNKRLVDKALNFLERLGFIQKQVVPQEGRKGGRPFHLYSYVPEGERVRDRIKYKVKVNESKAKGRQTSAIIQEIRKITEEFLQTLKQIKSEDAIQQNIQQREWYKRNARAFAELTRIKNWFNKNDNLVVLFTDPKSLAFLKRVYGSRAGLGKFFDEDDEEFRNVFWRVFPYMDEPDEKDKLEKRVLVHKGGRSKTVYLGHKAKQVPIVYVVNFCQKSKVQEVYSFQEAFQLLDDGTGEALKVFKKYLEIGYFSDFDEENEEFEDFEDFEQFEEEGFQSQH